MKKNLSLERIHDLTYLLKRPLEEITFAAPEKMMEALGEAGQKITVHLYPLRRTRRARRTGSAACLRDYYLWHYNQIYLALREDKIFALVGHGDTSSGREYHNHCLDLLLQDGKLRKEIPAAILISYRKEIISYYFPETFAYSNHDIDMNWHRGLAKRLSKAGVPYSQRRGTSFYGGTEIYFHNQKGEESLLYKAVEEDTSTRRFRQRLKQG